MRREVVAAVPIFLSALTAAAESDVVVTLPSRIAAEYAPRFGLSIFVPPLEICAFQVPPWSPPRAAGATSCAGSSSSCCLRFTRDGADTTHALGLLK